MFRGMEKLSSVAEWLSEDIIRVEVFCDGEYYGVMYYETAKRGFTNKPITGGWVCVDAKIQESLYRTYSAIEPKTLIGWGMSQAYSLSRATPYTTIPHTDVLPFQGGDAGSTLYLSQREGHHRMTDPERSGTTREAPRRSGDEHL